MFVLFKNKFTLTSAMLLVISNYAPRRPTTLTIITIITIIIIIIIVIPLLL